MKIKVQQNNIEQNTTDSFESVVLNFCSNFPKNAVSWIDATQEISTLAKSISEMIDIPIPTNLVSTPGEFNTKYRKFIEENIKFLDGHQQQEILNDYKHWFNSPLFESNNPAESEEKDIKALALSKTKKFELDNGLYFETINSGKIDNKISLKWHVLNTFSIDEFIESVRSVVKVTEQDLTSNDISRLTAHYNKYSTK